MTRFLITILISFFISTACSSTETANNTPDTETLAVPLTAAEGGVIILSDGAQVSFPPGALATDGVVTFSRVSCDGFVRGEGFGSCLYEVS
ncbi:hypothetical protein KKF84_06575, partial [Myxococcota bacterium]|nr:hypothetical protein [Myxococcota bacterium]